MQKKNWCLNLYYYQQVSDLISEMSVSSDSVVATVTIKLKSGTKQLRVDWGDDKSTRIRLDRIASIFLIRDYLPF
ncbi:MAG: hypothetical protein V9E88_17390 [Ferruginibacter sp.]